MRLFNFILWPTKIKLSKYIQRYLALNCCTKYYAWRFHSINNILLEFERHIKKTLYTDSFSIVLCEQLLVFLQRRNLMDNSIRDILLKIQAMLNRAASEGYKVKNNLRHVIPKYTISQQVYLTKEDLTSIYNLTNLSYQLEIIRDTFLLACYTGLRISDLVTLKRLHIIDNHIIKRTLKTNYSLHFPLHHSALEILSKYNNEIPKLKTIQYYNRGIKIICQKAGITQQVTREYRKGGKLITETVEKYILW